MSIQWDDVTIPELKRLKAAGISYRQIARKMGTTVGSIAGAVRRHIYGIKSRRTEEQKQARQERHRRQGKARVVVQPSAWSEAALTEPYAIRKLRLAAERARAA